MGPNSEMVVYVDPLGCILALSPSAYAKTCLGRPPGIFNIFPNGFKKGPYIPISFKGTLIRDPIY